MNLRDAETLARALMAEHGLLDKGWSFRWDNAKTRLGSCWYGRRTITLSRPIARLNDEAKIRGVVLHEIAHALAPRNSGHGPAWKSVCRMVGAEPVRCDADASLPEPAFKYVCPRCGKTFPRHRRMPRPRYCTCTRSLVPRFIPANALTLTEAK